MKRKTRFLGVFLTVAISLVLISFYAEASMRFSGKNIHDVFREANTGSLVGLKLGCGDDSADTQVLFNKSEVCTGEAALTWDYTNDLFTIAPGALTSVTVERSSISSSARTLTLTDGTTITNQRINQFLAPVINGVAAGGTETVTNASTLFIDGPPAGSNIIFTNPYSFWINTGDVSLGMSGEISRIRTLNQTSSNTSGKSISILTGNGNGSGLGGDITIQAGNSGATGSGGDVDLIAGVDAGSIDITSGNGGNNIKSGGFLTLTSGDAFTLGDGGYVIFNPGEGAGNGGIPGIVQINAPDGIYPNGLTTWYLLQLKDRTSSSIVSGGTATGITSLMIEEQTIDGILGGTTETCVNCSALYLEGAPTGSNITYTDPADIMFGKSITSYPRAVIKVEDQTSTNTNGKGLLIETANGSGSGGGGSFSFTTGDGGTTGISGNMTFTIGTSTGTNKNGGDVSFVLGNTTGSGTGGNFLLDRTDVTGITVEQIVSQFKNTSIGLADTTTIADQRTFQFLAPTINGVAAGGAEVVTNSSTIYINAAPSGSDITLTNPYALWIDAGDFRSDGHIIDGGSSPTLSACGTTPSISGGDHGGKITIGTGVTISCTATFAATYDNAPACVIAGDNTAVTYATTTSTSALTITSSADMASDVLSYICVGYGT